MCGCHFSLAKNISVISKANQLLAHYLANVANITIRFHCVGFFFLIISIVEN